MLDDISDKVIVGIAPGSGIACATCESRSLCSESTRSNDTAECVEGDIYAASTTKSIALKVARFSTQLLRISGSTRKREE